MSASTPRTLGDAGSHRAKGASSGHAAAEGRPIRHEYEYRCLDLAELERFNDLYNVCYGSDRPIDDARWLYAENPHGPAVIFAAFDRLGALVGVRPAIPFRQTWGGRERTAYEFADALVHPEHRRRGIFSRLVRQACAWAAQQNYTLYSIPNENSLSVYRKFPELEVIDGSMTRARPLAWVRYFAHQLGGLDARSVSGRIPAHPPRALRRGDLQLRMVDGFESDFDDIHAELERRVACFTIRRRDFLQWRYISSPVRRYHVALVEEHDHILGYVVLRMLGPVAQLVDVFLWPDPKLARRVLGLAAQWARSLGAIGIHFNTSRGNLYHRAAARCGYWVKKRSGSLVIDRASAREMVSARGLAAADLYLVMGDFDFM